MLLQANHISKSFGTHSILRDLTFQLNAGEKIGLVGRNGCGKTTLFHLLAGNMEPDEGQVVRHTKARIGLMQQLVHAADHRSLLDEALTVFKELQTLSDEIERLETLIEKHSASEGLQSLLDEYGQLQTRWEMEGGYSFQARTKAVLFGLGFSDPELNKSTTELSGGELNRLNLAKLLLSQPNLLLLDEPTNHLDIPSVQWLEEFLVDYPHAFIVISHDRYFLDHTVNQIFDLMDGRVEEYSGNYSRYVLEKEKRQQHRQKEYELQQELIARTEDFIRRNIAGQNTRQAKARQKMLDRMEKLDKVQSEHSSARFRFEVKGQSVHQVLNAQNLQVGYPGARLAGPLDLRVYRGDRIGIIGPNGSGKTTLLKTFLGAIPPLGGLVEWGAKVDLAFYDQQLSSLNMDMTVIEEIRQIAPLVTEETLRGYLARFLFRGDEVYKPVINLSGGEKSRLALAKLIFGKANTLVLDEPTNHLDIPSREALEEALTDFPGTFLVVSHDRYLINKLATRLIYMDGEGHAEVFEGEYEEFHSRQPGQKKAAREKPFLALPEEPMPAEPAGPARLSKNEYNKLKGRGEALEQEISCVEDEIQQVTAAMNDPVQAADYLRVQELGAQFEDLTARKEQLYEEWAQTLARLES
jgi:ATP-binding cassette, subfamily F, member 3